MVVGGRPKALALSGSASILSWSAKPLRARHCADFPGPKLRRSIQICKMTDILLEGNLSMFLGGQKLPNPTNVI